RRRHTRFSRDWSSDVCSSDLQAVAETVSSWTGIPLGRMVANEINTVLNLKSLMEEAIIGQSHALEAIAQRIRTSRAGLADPRTRSEERRVGKECRAGRGAYAE